MASIMESMSPVDAVIFGARFEQELSKTNLKLCWERCVDTMHTAEEGAPTAGEHVLNEPTRRCVDACVSKFAETAMTVSMEKQLWEADMMRQQQAQSVAFRAACGAAATAAAVGLGCYLFKGGDD
uniref:Mitochondrial import inner membrane translocase subunit n=1 Tax=Alexandrium andersonii TaxID=327968 RepID=A0A7S2B1I4_9DINO|mmetsp:Transcript_20903/g.47605  ORF Transcript_20903/g.47605 Transcript_20903/m.47605 type:complete len:125 (+) Transcript_20903:113-487(+)